jgi:hypothetical protein
MFEVRPGIKYIILIYILVSLFIYKIKPDLIFKNEKMKQFGLGKNKTIFSFHTILIFIAFLLFYIFELIWLRKNNFL